MIYTAADEIARLAFNSPQSRVEESKEIFIFPARWLDTGGLEWETGRNGGGD